MKKFLGKLFGSNKDEGPQYKHKQRSPRVRVPLTDDASFIASTGQVYALRNLSESGLALLSPEERFPDEAWGELRVGSERVTIRIVTVRRNGDDVGVSITDGGPAVRTLLRRVFSDEFKALEMSEVDSSRQKAVDVGNPKWFYAPGNYELFYVEHEGKLVRFELEWNGNVLALAADGTLRYGTVDPQVRDAPEHAKSDLVKWAGEVKPEHKAKALRLVENVPGLEGEIRKQLQALLA